MKFSANEDPITMVRDWAIAGDDVDPELVERPRRWDTHFILRFRGTFVFELSGNDDSAVVMANALRSRS